MPGDFDDEIARGSTQDAGGDARPVIQLAAIAPTLLAGVSAGAVPRGPLQRIVPGPDGVVTLPPGTLLDEVHVSGRDLVAQLADGSILIIVDGAVLVPQLVIGDVEVPPANLAALLIHQEPKPTAECVAKLGRQYV